MPKKSSKKAKSQRSRERALLEKVNLNAAGIDVGAKTHWVAVPEDRDESPVRSFGVFTSDLIALCSWLKRCQVETIAMESTGVYWIPLFQMLERNGFKVCLVNARHAKNVPGRKSDVKDCQWLQELHTFGRLVSSRSLDLHGTELPSAARYSEQGLQQPGAAHAEGSHRNEYSDPSSHQRHNGDDRDEYFARHCCRRTRLHQAGPDEASSNQEQRSRDCQSGLPQKKWTR
jgi:hypothetical protein